MLHTEVVKDADAESLFISKGFDVRTILGSQTHALNAPVGEEDYIFL